MGGRCGKGNAKKEKRYIDESSDSSSLSSNESKSSSVSSKSSKKSSKRKSPKDKGPSSRGGTSGTRKPTTPSSPTKNKTPRGTTSPQVKKLVKRANPPRMTPPAGQFTNQAVRPSTPSTSRIEAPRPPAPSASQFPYGQSTTSKYYIPAKDLNSQQAIILMPKQQQTQGKQSTFAVTPSQSPHSAPPGNQYEYYQQHQVNLQGSTTPVGPIPPPPNFEQMQQYEHMLYNQRVTTTGHTPFPPPPPVEMMQQQFKMEQTITDGSSTPPPASIRDGQQQYPYASPPPFPVPPFAPPSMPRQTQESHQQNRIVMLQLPQPEVPPSQQPPPPMYLPLPKREDYYAQLNNKELQNQILAHFEQQVKIRAAQPPQPPSLPSVPPQPSTKEGGATFTTTYNHKFQTAAAPQPPFPTPPYFPMNSWQHYFAYRAQQQQLEQQRAPPPPPPPPPQMHQFEMYHKQQVAGGMGPPQPTYTNPYQLDPRIQYQDYQQNRQQVGHSQTPPKPSSRSTSAGSSKVCTPTLKTTTVEQLDQLHREVQELKKMIKEQDTKQLMVKIDGCVDLYKQATKQYTQLMYNAKLRSQIGRSDSMIGQQMSKIQNNYDHISSHMSLLSNEVQRYSAGAKRSPGNTSYRDKFQKNSVVNVDDLKNKMKAMMDLINTLKESYSPEIMNTILAKDTTDHDRDEPGSDTGTGGESNGFKGSSSSNGSSNDSNSSSKQ